MQAVLTLTEAAKRGRMNLRTLQRLNAAGDGPPIVHLSRRRRGIFEHDLESWLDARRVPPTPKARAPRA